MVMDDGTVWRVADKRYFLTSSTGGADRMSAHLSYVRKVLAPQLQVTVANVQEHWAAAAVAGPLAKTLVETLMGEGSAPRHMSLGFGPLAGVPTMILAASYSGERAFEIYAPSHQIGPVWSAIVDQARQIGGCLYGLEALEILRIEKGHIVVGGEIDGRATAEDLGLGKMLRPAGGFVGATALARPALSDPNRLQLIGLEAISGTIPEGSMLITAKGAVPCGHVTAAGMNVVQGGSIALGFLQGGRARMGEVLTATSPTRKQDAKVRVVSPVFYDQAGERYRD
jgi:sarcosine oxidase subunit alpha